MEVVKLTGSPPSRRVRPQSSNARTSGQLKNKSNPNQQPMASPVVQIPSVYEQSPMQRPKSGRIFSTKSVHQSFSPTGVRTGVGSPSSPNHTRSFSPNRFGGPGGTRPGTSSPGRDVLSLRPGSSTVVRPTSPAEQRQTINELICKTNFLLDVLEDPASESSDGIGRPMTRARARDLARHIEICERELQEAGRIMQPVSRIPKSRPKSALTLSLSVSGHNTAAAVLHCTALHC
jgi:hypothetical protein